MGSIIFMVMNIVDIILYIIILLLKVIFIYIVDWIMFWNFNIFINKNKFI